VRFLRGWPHSAEEHRRAPRGARRHARGRIERGGEVEYGRRAVMVEYESKSWAGVVFRLRGSVIPALLPRILLCAAIGGVAAWLFVTYGIKLPSIAHTLLGVALGLLLVFRTNASYDRYWEGRRLLGGFVNRSRDLARQAAAYIDGDGAEAQADRRAVARLLSVFYALLRQYLRKERDLTALGCALSREEEEALEPVAVRPTLACVWLTRVLAKSAREGRLSPERLHLMDGNVTQLVDIWGGAERIMKTPIPFAYAQHIKSFLMLFCFTAPFAMVEQMRWYTPIAAAVLAFGMFGIDEIGVEIEDPFGYDPNDLPLDAMGQRLTEDTASMVTSAPVAAPAAKAKPAKK
jgi:putative membrane protein